MFEMIEAATGQTADHTPLEGAEGTVITDEPAPEGQDTTPDGKTSPGEGETAAESCSQPTGEDSSGPAGAESVEAKPETAPAAKAEVKKPADGIASDPYEWGRCAITLSVVWLPGGQVMAGVRNHLDAPIVTLLTGETLAILPGHAAELPIPTAEALADLLAQLREDLPNRAAAKTARDEAERKKADDDKARRATAASKTVKAKKAEPKKAEGKKKAEAKPKKEPAKPKPTVAQVSLFDLLTGG